MSGTRRPCRASGIRRPAGAFAPITKTAAPLAIAVLVAGCHPTRSEAPRAIPPSGAAPGLPPGTADLEPDVALVLTSGEDHCTWQLVDAVSKKARRALKTPGACPERVVFDPFAATTYFESDGTIFEAPWSARAASAVAPLPALATEPRLFISEATGRLRLQTSHELPEDAAVDEGGRRSYRFENKLYPGPEYASGIASMILVWELQPAGREPRWQRITTELTSQNPFIEPANDEPDRQARAGTVSLRELLIHRDSGSELRELGGALDPQLVALFPPVPGLDEDEPSAAVFHLDQTHHLVAAISTGDEVQITEPIVYCATPCDRWQQLTEASTPPGALDQRAYASHLPLYIGVRSGLALVEEMVRGDRVSFYASGGATPVMRIESSIGAWGPFRGLWARTR